MRSNKVSTQNIPVGNPVNKLRKDAPQIQSPVAPKKPGKQFMTGSAVDALKSLFLKQAKQGK